MINGKCLKCKEEMKYIPYVSTLLCEKCLKEEKRNSYDPVAVEEREMDLAVKILSTSKEEKKLKINEEKKCRKCGERTYSSIKSLCGYCMMEALTGGEGIPVMNFYKFVRISPYEEMTVKYFLGISDNEKSEAEAREVLEELQKGEYELIYYIEYTVFPNGEMKKASRSILWGDN